MFRDMFRGISLNGFGMLGRMTPSDIGAIVGGVTGSVLIGTDRRDTARVTGVLCSAVTGTSVSGCSTLIGRCGRDNLDRSGTGLGTMRALTVRILRTNTSNTLVNFNFNATNSMVKCTGGGGAGGGRGGATSDNNTECDVTILSGKGACMGTDEDVVDNSSVSD